jgi:hypothetical protein
LREHLPQAAGTPPDGQKNLKIFCEDFPLSYLFAVGFVIMELENSKGALTHLVTTRKPQKLRPTVLVLVTDQRSCDRLILAGRQLADTLGCVLQVQNIAQFGNTPDPEAIEHLYRTSLDAGAIMTVHYSENPEQSLVQLLGEELPHYVVTGMPGGGSDLLPRLWTRFEYLTFYTVDAAGEAQQVTAVDRALA